MSEQVTFAELAELTGERITSIRSRHIRDDRFPRPVGKKRQNAATYLLFNLSDCLRYLRDHPIRDAPTAYKEDTATLKELAELSGNLTHSLRTRWQRDDSFPKPVGKRKEKYAVNLLFKRSECLKYLAENPIRGDQISFDNDQALRFITGSKNPNTSAFGKGRYRL